MNSIIKATRRTRYILFSVSTSVRGKRLTDQEMINALHATCRSLFQKEWKDMGLWLVRFNGTEGILRCKAQEKDTTLLLLQSIKEIETKKVEITTHATSGTIRGITG